MKDSANPTREELIEWAFSEEMQPEQDFDLMVASEEHGDTMAELAADESCPKRRFFLACLYIFVGDAVRSKYMAHTKEFTEALVRKYEQSDSNALKTWAARSRSLMARPHEFDYDKWCGWGFVNEK